ncbi:LemA family protein [Mesomycoplasma lagogenitalium]|uniref:LemA family protein n=1 Tax=Mesomycoplasma lagogenitalium TaxID=171286 RepID=A0ABY8LW75_9BACT|nr:LemA family protein [Mesomycoplasma lagogenitalium]WGI36793.1 LemA family protein [Mesomycoplasma lagogenitalium]
MSNLFNNREYNNPKGLEPAVDNLEKSPNCSVATKVIFWIFGTLLLFAGPIYYLVKRNKFLRIQNEINEAASGIDTQLAKRADTLIKLVDQVKSFKNFEKEILTDVTKMRSLMGQSGLSNAQELQSLSNSVLGRLIAVSENYPELKSNQLYYELMNQTSYLEREIAASRRLYNSKVTAFNSEIFVWPANIVSSDMKLSTLPLFQASEIQRQDVSMKDL